MHTVFWPGSVAQPRCETGPTLPEMVFRGSCVPGARPTCDSCFYALGWTRCKAALFAAKNAEPTPNDIYDKLADDTIIAECRSSAARRCK